MYELPSSSTQDDFDVLIDRWVMTKYHKSNSVRTRDNYLMMIKRFRTYLQEHECDIDADFALLLPLLEEWIGATHRPGLKVISPATRNLRAAILSNFYRFALVHGVLDRNPLDRIERGTPAEPRRARPLDDQVVERKLGAIDRTTPLGLRDYALIVIAVTTGRRAGEIAAMRLGHLTPTEQGILVRWPRLKGGKTTETLVEYPIAHALFAHLVVQDGPQWHAMPSADPVWRVQSYHGQGNPLGYKGIQNVYHKHLGVTTVHSTRHTFALALTKLGVPLTDIQRLLQHSSLAVTQRYIEHDLPTAVNPYSQQLGTLFGLSQGSQEDAP